MLKIKGLSPMLQEFLHHLVELQVDQSSSARKWLAGFLESAATQLLPAATLGVVLAALAVLVNDSTAAVAKRAVMACNVAFRRAVACVVAQVRVQDRHGAHCTVIRRLSSPA